jgi:hypothetical protein
MEIWSAHSGEVDVLDHTSVGTISSASPGPPTFGKLRVGAVWVRLTEGSEGRPGPIGWKELSAARQNRRPAQRATSPSAAARQPGAGRHRAETPLGARGLSSTHERRLRQVKRGSVHLPAERRAVRIPDANARLCARATARSEDRKINPSLQSRHTDY